MKILAGRAAAKPVHMRPPEGVIYPENPSEGQLFFNKDPHGYGLCVFIQGSWRKVITTGEMIIPSASDLPEGRLGSIFIKNDEDESDGFYFFNNDRWQQVAHVDHLQDPDAHPGLLKIDDANTKFVKLSEGAGAVSYLNVTTPQKNPSKQLDVIRELTCPLAAYTTYDLEAHVLFTVSSGAGGINIGMQFPKGATGAVQLMTNEKSEFIVGEIGNCFIQKVPAANTTLLCVIRGIITVGALGQFELKFGSMFNDIQSVATIMPGSTVKLTARRK